MIRFKNFVIQVSKRKNSIHLHFLEQQRIFQYFMNKCEAKALRNISSVPKQYLELPIQGTYSLTA